MTEFRWSWPSESPARSRRAAQIEAELGVSPALARAVAYQLDESSAVSDLARLPLKARTEAIGEPAGTAEAAAALLQASRNGRIGILCDFDVDGAASQAILIEALRSVSPAGAPDPPVVVPYRNTEGFGPNQRCLDRLQQEGVTCVAVLDCGTAAGELLDHYCSAAGIAPVVVDHHPGHGAQPPATGVLINPWESNGPDPGEQGSLCAAALTWFVARAILRQAGVSAEASIGARMRMTLLAALGTACDVMPVDKPFNRALIRAGMKLLSDPAAHHPGVAAIREVAGLGSSRSDAEFGWRIGPRINAGSRMGESELAARCLRERDPAAVRDLASQLDSCNKERVDLGNRVKQRMEEHPDYAGFADGPLIVHVAEGSTPGTVGLVASDIVRRFGWPAIACATREDGLLAGSGRSALGFDLGTAVSAACAEGILLSGGGHASACGLKLEPGRLEDLRSFLRERFRATADRDAAGGEIRPTYRIGAEMVAEDLSDRSLLAFAEGQDELSPWGQGLERPWVGARDCVLQRCRRLNGGHLLLTLARDGQRFPAVWWRPPRDWPQRLGQGGSSPAEVPAGEPSGGRTDVIGRIELNEWRSTREGRLTVEDARPAGTPDAPAAR